MMAYAVDGRAEAVDILFVGVYKGIPIDDKVSRPRVGKQNKEW